MKKWAVGILLAALACLALWASPARAQTEFRLRVSPEDVEVPVGTDFILELIVEDGVNLNAFDVLVDFNPQVLDLVNWELGDYFANLAVVSVDVQPSFLRVAATQLASEPASGDGVLLTMSFNAAAQGISLIELTQMQFVDADGNNLEPEPVEGEVLVVNAPTYTSTATVTFTPTPTRTSSPTLTAAFTATPSATNTGVFVPSPSAIVTASPTPTLTQTPTAVQTQEELSATFTPPGYAEGISTSTALAGPIDQPEGEPSQAVEPVVPTEVPLGEDQEEAPQSWVKGLLWGTLVIGVIVLAVLGWVMVRRRQQRKHEDLLL